MQIKETSFIHKLISSIRDFEEYPQMASKSFKIVIKYLLKLMLIFTCVVTIVSIYEISKDIQSGIEYFKTQIPDLEFTNNELTVYSKEKIRIEANNIINLIIIDTNCENDEQINTYIDDIENNNTGIIFLKDKIIVNIGEGTQKYSYEKVANMYNIGNMTKQDILAYFTGTNVTMLYIAIFIISFIWLFIAYTISVLLDALALGIVGYVTSLLLRLRIKFVAIIKMAIHALTLPIMLNLCYILLQTLFNLEIKYFDIMYVTVGYIYIITAILMIKTDLIKRGQELTKIIEEEQKIKEELKIQEEKRRQEEKRKEEEKRRQEEKRKEEEKRRQEEKRKEEEKRRQEEKRKEEEKENKEKDDLGIEPQSGNA